MAIDLPGFDDLTKDLDALVSARVPEAAAKALYQTGPYLRRFHAREMQATFRGPVSFTTRSIRYRVNPRVLSLELSISEDGAIGQAPTNYLEPVFKTGASTRGTALTTRFSKRLGRSGVIRPGVHLVPNTRARLARTRKGRLTQANYSQALIGLRANEFAGKSRSADRWFAIDSSSTANRYLDPGVYRAKGDSISQIFAALDAAPSVPRIYDWADSTIEEAEDQILARFGKELGI